MRIISSLREFIARESAGGILLALAAAAALALANSPLDFLYAALLGYALSRASLPQVLPPR
jgi:Na+/H+ antiporter NhaA